MTTFEQIDEAAQPIHGSTDVGADVAAVCLRFILGVIILGHGLQKLGWFKAPGWPSSISEQADFVEFFGYSNTNLMAWLITITEVATGALLLLGLLTPLASIGLAFTMLVAASVHALVFNDPFVAAGGGGSFEPSLGYLMVSILFLAMGPGRFSLDKAIFGQRA